MMTTNENATTTTMTAETACNLLADALGLNDAATPATVETCPHCSKRWVKVDGARPHACGAAKPAARNDEIASRPQRRDDQRRPKRGAGSRNERSGSKPRQEPAPKKAPRPSPSYREEEAARAALKREFLETSSSVSDKTTDWKKGTRETKSGIVYRERGRQVTASRGGVSVTFYR